MARNVGTMIGRTLSTTIKGAVGALGLGGAGIIGNVLFSGFERLKNIDSAKFKLRALGNSAEDVQKIMDSAMSSVKGTAFSLDEAATSAASAVAAGVKPGQQLTEYLVNIADASAIAGTSFAEMGDIFNKVRTQGNAFTDDLQMLQTRGIPIFQWLQEEYGVSAEAMSKMVSDGKVDAQSFEAAIDKHIGGAAQKMGQSFDGAVKNLQASMARLGANFLTAILGGGGTGDPMENAAAAIERLTVKFDEMGQWVNTHRDDIHDFFTRAKDIVVDLANAVKDVGTFLKEHPGLIQAAVAAFVGFKTISGVAALATSLAGINAALGLMPGLATAALGPIAALLAAGTGAYFIGTAGDSPFPGVSTPSDPTGERGLQNRATGTSIMGVPSAVNDPIFAATPEAPNIPGGGGPNASRERRGLPPVNPGLLGGGFVGNEQNGMRGAPGQGFPMTWNPGQGGLNWSNIDSIAANNGLTMTSGYRDPNGPTLGGVPASRSYHGSGRARDYAGTPAQNAAFYNLMKNTYGSQLKELLHEDIGTANEHVHVAYDTGGWLPPGRTSVVNNTGEPELILNPEQIQELSRQGLDPNSLLHGTTNKAAPGPMPGQMPQTSNRSEGFVPVAASNTGVAGTSMVSNLLNMGSEAIGGVIDMGAQAASMAASAAIAAGTMGGGAAGGGQAASAGIQIAADIAKRGVSYGFQLAGIGADSLIEQLFPFGAPRWMGYDYTAFAPSMGGNTGVTTLEKAQNQAAGIGGQDAGGPVNPETMPGMAAPITQHQGTQAMPGPMTSAGEPLTAIPTSRNMNPDMSTLTEANVLQKMMGYDQGGMLPPGGIGINMTRKPEPVLTPQQWDSIGQSMNQPAGGSPLVKIDNIYGMSPDDVANKIEAKQKLAMMRYAGRP
jgi:tape measure domain-containing protein